MSEHSTPVTDAWRRRTAWGIFLATLVLALLAASVASAVHEGAQKEACEKVGGVLADNGHGLKNCVPKLDPTGSKD